MLELVRDPGVRVAHARERVELHLRVHVHVVVVDGRLQRYLVAGEARGVVDGVPARVLHEEIHGGAERLELGHLLEHPGEGGLARKEERACGDVELGALCLLRGSGPADGHGVAVGVDELLERPVERVRCRGGALERAHEESLRDGGGAGAERAVAVLEGVVEDPVHALKARLHAEVASKELQALDGHGRAVGQEGLALGESVGKRAHALDIARIAIVELGGLCGHAREGVLIDLGGAGRHMRDAAAGKARRHALGEEREIGEGEKTAVALPERDPGFGPELREAQVLEVAHDRARKIAFEIVGLGARGVRPFGLGALAELGDAVPAHPARAPRAALVGQHDAKVLDGFLDPAVRGGGERAGRLAARASLQIDECRKVGMDILGRCDRAVEELGALGRAGDRGSRGAASHGAADGEERRFEAAPVEGHVDGVVLYVEARHVIASEFGHRAAPLSRCRWAGRMPRVVWPPRKRTHDTPRRTRLALVNSAAHSALACALVYHVRK